MRLMASNPLSSSLAWHRQPSCVARDTSYLRLPLHHKAANNTGAPAVLHRSPVSTAVDGSHRPKVLKLRPQYTRHPASVRTSASAAWDTTPAEVGQPEAASSSYSWNYDGGSFDWFSQWYPVHAIDHLDSSRPHPVKLMGRDLVLWRDGNGQWNCFEDKCPHRLAPLSEGRVEADGNLACAYHGWRFDGKGACTKLPQAENPVSEWSPRSIPCAVSYPTRVAAGLIFVWPSVGPVAEDKAAKTEIRGVPETLDPEVASSGRVAIRALTVRDIPHGWDYLMENAVDPAHVAVSHHGIAGDRHKDPGFFDLLPVDTLTSQDGFKFKVAYPDTKPSEAGIHEFRPPCFVRATAGPETSEVQHNVCVYATPTIPGQCRVFSFQAFVAKPGSMLPLSVALLGMIPAWVSHVTNAMFLHMDSVFIHFQERNVARLVDQGSHAKPSEAYLMPTPSDKMVAMFRKWYEQLSSGGVPYAPGTTPFPRAEYNTSKLFDTYNSHTKHCKICQGALKTVTLARNITTILAGVSYVAGLAAYAGHCAAQASISAAVAAKLATREQVMAGISQATYSTVAGPHAPPKVTVALLVIGSVLLLLAAALRDIRQLFFAHEFHHADNN